MARHRHPGKGGAVTDIVERLRSFCTDWDGSSMSNDTEPMPGLHCIELREAADEIERLRAAIAAPPVWQPIETAPKDGRKIIVAYVNRNGKPRTVMARWLTDERAAEMDTDGVGLEGGWYECIDNWDDYTEVAIHEGEPANWMPLPKGPTP